jgi:hypothetical protein
MNSNLLNVEAVGLYTQPYTEREMGTIAFKRFRKIMGDGSAGQEFDAIMIYPPPAKTDPNHVVSFGLAAREVAVDPFYMRLTQEMIMVRDTDIHPVFQPASQPSGKGYNYYVLTGSILAAVQCIELLTVDAHTMWRLKEIARIALDTRGKLKRFPWRPALPGADAGRGANFTIDIR